MKENLRPLLAYFTICLITFSLGGLFFELIFFPAVAWINGYHGYFLSGLDRIFSWIKFIVFSSLVCGVGFWFYEKIIIGR